MNMDPARLQRLLQTFDDALEQPVNARAAWLAHACGGDEALHREVEAMLAADAANTGEQADPITPKLDVLREEAAADPADLPAGTRIGPWNVQGVLGRGGMGAVYRVARADGAYQHEAALKRIRIGLDSALARQRFLRERQILARLQHPHIAGLLDGGVDEHNAPYFVMPLVDGERIDHWCDAHTLDVRSRVRLLLQVLDAVAFAHRQLVVHRDLKPSNIAVDASGHAFLLDFGIAKLMEDGDGDAGHTRTAERAFTPEYASPEQLHGEPVSTATDLYQLGVLLYALLAQAHPYGLTGETPLRTRLVRMDGDPQPLWDAALHSSAQDAAKRATTPPLLARQLRGDLSAISQRCVAADALRRYGSVDALRADLLAWMDGRPVAARAPTRRYRLGRFVRRNALAVGAVSAVLVALCIGLGSALWQAREARLQAQRADVVNAYLVDVFRSIDPDEGLGPDITARQLIDQGIARLDRGELKAQPAAEGKLRMTLADSYIALGEYPKADHQLQRALALLPASQADDVFEARFRQGEVRLLAEDLDGLEKNLQGNEAWLRAHVSTLSQPEIATAQLQLARAKLLAHREDYASAEPLARAAWQRTRKALGDSDKQTLSVWIEHAQILADMGRTADAIGQAQAIVAGIRRAQPFNEFQLASALNNLSVYLGAAGKAEDAIAHDQEALAIRRRILPPGHPYLALSLGNLANHLESVGRNKEALALHEQAVAIYRALPQGQENGLATEINNLGVACYELGDMTCAIDKIGEAIAVWSKVLPLDHSSVLTARSNLAALYSRGGRLQEGEAQLRQAVAALEATAKRAPSAAVVLALSNARNELTDNLLNQGKHAEALALSQLRWRDVQVGGEPNEAAVMALAMLALTELANGKQADALAHARAAQARAHAQGPDSRREAFALMTLARAQLASGDATSAVAQARKAITIFTTALSADHRDTGLAHGMLGRALLASGQRAEGKKELSAAIAILSKQVPWLPELAELRRLRA